MFVIAQIWDNRISVHEQGVLKYSQGWIQEFDIGGGGGGGGVLRATLQVKGGFRGVFI